MLLHRWTLVEGAIGVICVFVLPFVILEAVVGTTAFLAFCFAMLVSAGAVAYGLRRQRIERIRLGLNLDDSDMLRETADRAIVRGPIDT